MGNTQLLFNCFLVPKIITGGVFRKKVVCDKLDTLTALNVPAIIGYEYETPPNIYGHALGIIPCIY